MQMIPIHIIYITLLVVAFIVGVWITRRSQRAWHRRQGFVNQRKGRRAEHEAADLLEAEGFKIIDRNPRFTNQLGVNGDQELFEITPDFIATKDGVNYVVEVKNYSGHTSIHNAGVRRQVFEYLHATQMPCLLVRMPEGDIDLIERV